MTVWQTLQMKINQWASGGGEMIFNLLKAIPISLLVALVAWFVLTKLSSKHESIVSRKKAAVGLSFYVALLLLMGILQRPFGEIRNIVWTPFVTPGGSFIVVLYAMANCIIFIPLGILLYKTFPKALGSAWKVGLVSFGLSLFVEVLQYALACGQSEVEDLIMNTIGGVIGYFIIKAVEKRKRLKIDSDKEN